LIQFPQHSLPNHHLVHVTPKSALLLTPKLFTTMTPRTHITIEPMGVSTYIQMLSLTYENKASLTLPLPQIQKHLLSFPTQSLHFSLYTCPFPLLNSPGISSLTSLTLNVSVSVALDDKCRCSYPCQAYSKYSSPPLSARYTFKDHLGYTWKSK
jgi:hypothetical protein